MVLSIGTFEMILSSWFFSKVFVAYFVVAIAYSIEIKMILAIMLIMFNWNKETI